MGLKCIACSAPLAISNVRRGRWRCRVCGLECIWPQPDRKALEAIYGPSYFSHYKAEADQQTVRAMKRATYERQLRRLPMSSSKRRRLLDCGAASGILLELAREFGWDPFAVELSGWGAEACVRLFGAERVHNGQVEESRFAANPEGKFEVITMFDFLEHVCDPRAVIEWARQRLTEEGALLLTTPRVGSASWWVMRGRWFHYTSEHLWYFSATAVRMLLSRAGFKTIELRPAYKAVTIGYALSYYLRASTYSLLFSPPANVLNSLLPASVKRRRIWCLLGEMSVLARP